MRDTLIGSQAALVSVQPTLAHASARSRAMMTFLRVEVCLSVCLFIYFLFATRISAPVSDLFDWVTTYLATTDNGQWWDYIWIPHNEHRPALIRVLVAIDINLTGGTEWPVMMFGVALLLCVAWISFRILYTANISKPAKQAVFAFVVVILTQSNIALSCSYPVIQGILQSGAFAFLAISTFALARTAVMRSASLILAIAAAWGVTAGLIVWAPLVWLAWRGRMGWRWIFAVLIVGGIYCAVFMLNLPRPSTQIDWSDPGRLVMFADYVVRFLGMPWSRVPAFLWPSRLVGVSVLGVFLWAFAMNFAGKTRNETIERIGIALVFFVSLVAIAAAFGRLDASPDDILPIRYAPIVTIGHVGILFILARGIRTLIGRHETPVLAAAGVLIAALLVQQIMIGIVEVRATDRINDAWARFTAGEWTDDMNTLIFPGQDNANARLQRVRQAHIYGE